MYNTQHSKNTKNLDTPITGNPNRMDDGRHVVTIRDVTKTVTASGIDTLTLELVNSVGDTHTAAIFLYRKGTDELSNIFKKLLAAAFHDSVSTIKEIIQLIAIEDWLVLDYLIESEIVVTLKSSAGYRIKNSTKGYTFNEKDYYDTIRDLRHDATIKNLTPSYTNVIDITRVGDMNECNDNTIDEAPNTKADPVPEKRTDRFGFMGGKGTKPISRKKFI